MGQPLSASLMTKRFIVFMRRPTYRSLVDFLFFAIVIFYLSLLICGARRRSGIENPHWPLAKCQKLKTGMLFGTPAGACRSLVDSEAVTAERWLAKCLRGD